MADDLVVVATKAAMTCILGEQVDYDVADRVATAIEPLIRAQVEAEVCSGFRVKVLELGVASESDGLVSYDEVLQIFNRKVRA